MCRLPWWLRWQRICLQSRRSGFDPWVAKISWRRERHTYTKECYSAIKRTKSCHLQQPTVRVSNGSEKWQPTPVLLPVRSHGRKSLLGYSPWGCKESVKPEHSTKTATWMDLEITVLNEGNQTKTNIM